VTALEEFLDVELARVVDVARMRFGGGDAFAGGGDAFAGAVSGFLLRTAIELAAHHGAPRGVLDKALRNMVALAYATKAKS